jgi:hypothetical protein
LVVIVIIRCSADKEVRLYGSPVAYIANSCVGIYGCGIFIWNLMVDACISIVVSVVHQCQFAAVLHSANLVP